MLSYPFTIRYRMAEAYLLWNINEGRGSQLGERVQGDNDHRSGGVRVHQVL